MSNKNEVHNEVDLRIEEITIKLKELTRIADANDINFSINVMDKDYYCSQYIEDNDWLSDQFGTGSGQWLSSSDFC